VTRWDTRRRKEQGSHPSPLIVERGAIHPDTQILRQVHPKKLHLPSLHAKVSVRGTTKSEVGKAYLDALVLNFS
jgi:hypothetical protein